MAANVPRQRFLVLEELPVLLHQIIAVHRGQLSVHPRNFSIVRHLEILMTLGGALILNGVAGHAAAPCSDRGDGARESYAACMLSAEIERR